jgi:ribonuclease-3
MTQVSAPTEEQEPTPESPAAPVDARELAELQERLGYRFEDPALLRQALTHKSHAHEAGDAAHNESMEFLGDAVLGFLVTDFIYRDFPDLTEGRKSKIKAFLVSASALHSLAVELEIPRFLRLGKGEEKTGGRKKKALAANALEAIVAAIYLDQGIAAAREFLAPLYRPVLEDVQLGRAVVEDPKTALQEFLQAHNLEPAQYSVSAETGPEHRKTFHVELRIGGDKVAVASGTTKKKAELVAAQEALSKLLRNGPARGAGKLTPDR